MYDPVGPVPPVAADGLRFAAHQLAAACMLDQYCGDQHCHCRGPYPCLDNLAPKKVVSELRALVSFMRFPKNRGPRRPVSALVSFTVKKGRRHGCPKETPLVDVTFWNWSAGLDQAT
jgi:hypothetical protein